MGPNIKSQKKQLFSKMSMTLEKIYGTADYFFGDFGVGPIVRVVHNDEYYDPFSLT